MLISKMVPVRSNPMQNPNWALTHQLPAAPHAVGLESKNRSWFAGQIPGAPAGEQEEAPRHDSRRPPTTRASTFGHQVTANPTLVMVAVQQLRPLPCILA